MAAAPNLEQVQAELLRGIERAVSDFMANNGSVPMEQSAKAALDFAQAYVILHPALGPQGVPVAVTQAHEIGMANLQHQHSMASAEQSAIHAQQQAAAAPSPAKGAKP